MAIDWTTVLGGLGATVAAFGDPQQSLLMSQGIMRRNQQMRERKEREERQRQELALRQQKLDMEQAQMQQEAMRRQAASQMIAQQLDPNAGAQLASMAPAVYSPGQFAGVPTDPMQEAAMPRTAISDPTGQAPSLFVPQPTLKPGVFSGTPGQQRGRLPQHALTHARTLHALGDTEGAAKVLADAAEQQRKEAMPPEPTASMRNFEAWRDMTPQQRDDWAAYQEAQRAGVTIVNEAELPDPEPGYTWKLDAKGNRVLEDYIDPRTGEVSKRYAQIPATWKNLTSEELRTVGLAGVVIDQVGQVRQNLLNFSATDRATYAARGLPIIGDFFANTEGGRTRLLHDTSIMNTGFAVSGAEAPEREVARLQRNHGFTIHDNLETALLKLDAQEALAQRVHSYRMGPGADREKAIPDEVVKSWQAEINADLQKEGKPQIPYDFDPGAGYRFSSYDPRGVYVYTNDDGERRYFPESDVIK